MTGDTKDPRRTIPFSIIGGVAIAALVYYAVATTAPRTYPLGAFFRVWGRPLDAAHLLDRAADADHRVVAYLNGAEHRGPPEAVPIDAHAVIVLEYGPPFVPPPPYTFPAGL